MIGVALVGFITVLASSTKASINESVDKAFTGDLVVASDSYGFGGLSPDLAHQLAELPEVEAASGIRMAGAEINGSGTMLVGVDPATIGQILDLGVVEGSLGALSAGQIAVSQDQAKSKGFAIGDTVPVRFAETGLQQLKVAAVYTEGDLFGGAYLVGLPAYEANVADQYDAQVFVNKAVGVTGPEMRTAVTRVTDGFPQAEVQDRAEFKAAQASQIDTILSLIYALLGLAVFIALLGIANTLALSIFERTRELGLLRAVGMTRSQLRSTVRWESVIIALLGTALGLVVGVMFGWAIVKALEDDGLSRFVVPGGQLAVVAVIAALAGVGAAILPARRASRLDVLKAITAT
jgi:putative ABC transport system permease protein